MYYCGGYGDVYSALYARRISHLCSGMVAMRSGLSGHPNPFTATPRFKLVVKPSEANVGFDASQQLWVPIVGSWLNPPGFPPQ